MVVPLFKRLGNNIPAQNTHLTYGLRRASSPKSTAGQNKTVGRSGQAPHATTGAGSGVMVFQNYNFNAFGASNVWALPTDSDWVAAVWTVTVSASSASVTTDVLASLGGSNNGIEFIGPEGPIITQDPVPDFYLFYQRFGQFGQALTATTVASATVTTSATATYYVPMNLPKAKGPYSVVVTTASSFASAATISVNVTLNLVPGTCPNGARTRYKPTSLPFTPGANGTNDLSTVATIQGPVLDELFLTGLTSNTADISFLQIESQGYSMTPRIASSVIVARDAAALSGTLNSTYLYPMLAFGTGMIFGRDAHFYMTFGASPSSNIRVGYHWND